MTPKEIRDALRAPVSHLIGYPCDDWQMDEMVDAIMALANASTGQFPWELCGASFMAGACCLLPAGHSGSHANGE